MHPTQRALLKAVAAAPNDDTPRLVYADWLDEHAADLPKKEREATAARAELIRVQCELARLAEEDSESRWVYEYLNRNGLYNLNDESYRVDWSELAPGLARLLTLRARQSQLLATHQASWQTEVAKIEGATLNVLQRGFWTHLHLKQGKGEIAKLVKSAKKQPDLIPPQSLSCETEPTMEEATLLAESGLLDHLTSVSSGYGPPALLAAVARTKNVVNVRTVDPGSSEHNYTAPLTAFRKWQGVRTISVMAHGDHGIPGLQSLARAGHLANLETLHLDDDGRANFRDEEAVANGVWKHLRCLFWEAFCLDDLSARYLVRGTALSGLRYLHLGRDLNGEAATMLLKSPTFKNLVVATLRGHDLSGLTAAALSKTKRPDLRVLDLPLSAKADLLALAKSPLTHHLRILQLGSGITDGTMKAFFSAMKVPQLTMLNLSGNRELSQVGAEAIAGCSRLANLQTLKLSWTKIGDTGAKALAQSKHLGKLRFLDVTNAGLTASGIATLRKRFGDEAVRA